VCAGTSGRGDADEEEGGIVMIWVIEEKVGKSWHAIQLTEDKKLAPLFYQDLCDCHPKRIFRMVQYLRVDHEEG
jgi:hypothetical protein